jgi:hypothetical protein
MYRDEEGVKSVKVEGQVQALLNRQGELLANLGAIVDEVKSCLTPIMITPEARNAKVDEEKIGELLCPLSETILKNNDRIIHQIEMLAYIRQTIRV